MTDYAICCTICFPLVAVEICVDKYVRKIITASRNHLKPIQGGTIRKEGM